jgi:hypothetical protein
VRILTLLPFFLVPALFGQTNSACSLVTQSEADALLGGASRRISTGATGCGYFVRTIGVRLTITVADAGASAQTTWEGMREQATTAKYLAGDEPGVGSHAYAQLIRRSDLSAAGKSGFVAVKGTKVLQIFVTDAESRQNLAGKKEMLDKIRPLAEKALERL